MIASAESTSVESNSILFSVVQVAIFILIVFQIFGCIAIAIGLIENILFPPIIGYIGIFTVLCGMIVLIGFSGLINAVKGLEINSAAHKNILVDIKRQAKNN